MFIKLYVISLVVFFALDAVWLGFLAKNFYRDQIGFLMKDNINWLAGILFYLIYIAGLVFFVISPAFGKDSWTQAFLHGALFGLIAYCAYDLTNLATIKNWPVLITIVDLIWGMVLSSLVSVAVYFLALKIFSN
jgi:uncharacterized membrane protein